MRNIHPTAIIDPKAQVAEHVSVGPYSVIGPDAVIGEGCVIHNHVTVSNTTILGKNVQVFPGAVLGGAPQDLKYKGEKTTLSVGDNSVIRECCTLNIGTALGGGRTVIGNNNLLMAYVHVAHDCVLHDNIVIANNAQLAGHVVVEDYARIAGLAGIHHFVTIGRCAFVAGCAKLSIDVPPFTLADGHPAKIKVLNEEGIRRRVSDPEAQMALKNAFRLCFRKKISRDEAYRQIVEQRLDRFPEVASFVAFLEATSRGSNGRALEAKREVVPVAERDGRMAVVKKDDSDGE